jgi:hypothetical protein
MKKLLFFIILSGIAFKLKAQQKPSIKPLEKFAAPKAPSLLDTALNLIIKPKRDLNLLFLPKQKQQYTASNNLVASLDKMPIVKPVGKWNMPVVHPDGTVVYTTPVKRLPPVIKPDSSIQIPRP